MSVVQRLASAGGVSILALTLVACGATGPTQPVGSYPSNTYPQTTYPQTTYPQTTYPQTTYPQNAPQANLEYGRITNIEFVQAESANTPGAPNVRNAVIGGVIGAVVGSMIGKNVNDGHNRSGATVLGGAAGAAAGSQVGKTQSPAPANAAYRVTVRTDGGAQRTYEVGPSTGDLRVGDRVRVENGVIYRA